MEHAEILEANKYTRTPLSVMQGAYKQISVFTGSGAEKNVDQKVVEGFGEEWEKFSAFSDAEIEQIGNQYFDIVTPEMVNLTSRVIDVGCGTGRWSKYLLNRGVGFIEAVDPSAAIFTADKLLSSCPNVRLTQATTDTLPFEDNSFDFGMSIGVLHHIPNTKKALADCVRKIKTGGYFYVYLYYNVAHRGYIFQVILNIVTAIRFVVSRMPSAIKKITCDLIALIVYMPLVVAGRLLNAMGLNKLAKKIPLQDYQDKSFFIIRNDALDRFGTRLEQRFTKKEVIAMMEACGLGDIVVSDREPWWHAVGRKLHEQLSET